MIVYSYENVWEVSKQLLSKHFSLAGKGVKGQIYKGTLVPQRKR